MVFLFDVSDDMSVLNLESACFRGSSTMLKKINRFHTSDISCLDSLSFKRYNKMFMMI